MVTLDEYKKSLIDVYRYEVDKLKFKKEKRKNNLSKCYSDEYLQKIIDDTYEFIKYILNTKIINFRYCSIDAENIREKHIDLGITGDFASDYLYDINGKIISKMVLKKILGNRFTIFIDIDEMCFETEEADVYSSYISNFLYMQGFPENIDEIKEELCGKQKQLIK